MLNSLVKRGGEGIQLVLEPAEHVVARVDEPLQLAGSRLQGSIDAFDLERGDRNPAIGGLGHVDLLRGALVDQVVAAVIDGNGPVRLGVDLDADQLRELGDGLIALVGQAVGAAGRCSAAGDVGDLGVELRDLTGQAVDLRRHAADLAVDRRAKLHGLVGHAVDRLGERLALQDGRLKDRFVSRLVQHIRDGAEELFIALLRFEPLLSAPTMFSSWV